MKKNYLNKQNTGLLIRIDDVTDHMNWELMDKCEELFDNYEIKPLLGVIPNNQDPEFKNFPKRENFWGIVRNWQKKGWEISMHGFNHIYETETNKNDYFEYGGKSEFYGRSFEEQNNKIKNGLNIFKKENIKIRSFFAPNHTYDFNTFKALKANNIINVIDGYGLLPYQEFGINFIPQLFYKEIMLPYGIQSTQIHLNYIKKKNFDNLENFFKKNQKKIIDFNLVLGKVSNSLFSNASKFILEKSLKLFRAF